MNLWIRMLTGNGKGKWYFSATEKLHLFIIYLPKLFIFNFGCIIGHHGPPKVNFWQDPLSPSKWKEEHVSLFTCFHVLYLSSYIVWLKTLHILRDFFQHKYHDNLIHNPHALLVCVCVCACAPTHRQSVIYIWAHSSAHTQTHVLRHVQCLSHACMFAN